LSVVPANARSGLSAVAAIRRNNQGRPSDVVEAAPARRYVTSPSVMPPSVVFTMSLSDGGKRSPKYSHIALPARAKGAACQKE